MVVIADEAVVVFAEPEIAGTSQDLVGRVRREGLPGVDDLVEGPGVRDFDQDVDMLWRVPSYAELTSRRQVGMAVEGPALHITDDLLKGGHHEEDTE